MKKEYILAISIQIREQLGETISDKEHEIVSSLRANDIGFKKLSDQIISNNYLSYANEYYRTDAEKRIASNIDKRITEIKQKGIAKRRRILTAISAAAAMIAIVITIGLQFITPESNLSSLNTQTENLRESPEEVVLITERGENIRLTGSTYYAQKKELPFISDTIKQLPEPQNNMATIVVPMTKDFNIVLSDGTKVWLNSGSKLIFPHEFSTNERVVEIDGEGYFEVAHNTQKPFIVKNLVMDTKVLGTKFLISAYSSDESRSVSLVEGRVEVHSCVSDYTLSLIPGRAVVFDANKHSFREEEVNIQNILSKVDGMLVFENKSLKTICTALMRKYGLTYTIKNEELGKKLFYVRTKKYDSIETVMELLKAAGGINYKIEETTLIIY